VVWPGANVRVPDLPTKSPSPVLAVPFAVAYLTLTSLELASDRRTVKTNAVRPEWPSARAMSLIARAGLALGRQRSSSDSSRGRNEKRFTVHLLRSARENDAPRRADRAPGRGRAGGGSPGGKDPAGRLFPVGPFVRFPFTRQNPLAVGAGPKAGYTAGVGGGGGAAGRPL